MNKEMFFKNLPLFEKELGRKRERINAFIGKYLPVETCYPPMVHQAIRYVALREQERMWGTMAVFAAEACRGDEDQAMPVACAMECVYAFTVVHNGLPGISGESSLGGQPSVHRAFGEGMAILAGDALLLAAFGLLAEQIKDGEMVRSLTRELCKHVGSMGVIGGFVMDILSRGRTPDEKTVEYIYSHKEGGLAAASAVLGGISADAPEEHVEALLQYGLKTGTAMQITHDIIRAQENVDSVGFGLRWKKEKEEKEPMNYVGLRGVGEAQKEASRLMREAVDHLRPMGRHAGKLAYLANYLLHRERN